MPQPIHADSTRKNATAMTGNDYAITGSNRVDRNANNSTNNAINPSDRVTTLPIAEENIYARTPTLLGREFLYPSPNARYSNVNDNNVNDNNANDDSSYPRVINETHRHSGKRNRVRATKTICASSSPEKIHANGRNGANSGDIWRRAKQSTPFLSGGNDANGAGRGVNEAERGPNDSWHVGRESLGAVERDNHYYCQRYSCAKNEDEGQFRGQDGVHE